MAGNERGAAQRAGVPAWPVGAALEGRLASAFFDVHTCGLLLLDRRGAVVAANLRAAEMLGIESDGGGRTCCDLFACQDPRGPLRGACVAAGTLARGRLDELRVDLPGAATAAYDGLLSSALMQSGYMLVEVQERQLPPDPRVPGQGRLRAMMLGRMRLEDQGGSVGGDWLEHRPGQLLKLLITERGRVVSVDEIAEALWSNGGRAARGNVRQCVYAVRSRLDDRGGRSPSVITAHRGGYSIDQNRMRLDCDEFESHMRRGMTAFRGGDADLARSRLTAGLDLYGGEYLADEPYAHWALDERTRLAGIASEGLRALAALAVRRHDYADATVQLERLAAIDDYDMEVQRGLIAVCLARGRRSEAKRRYMALSARLREEFGEEPSFSLADAGHEHGSLAALLAV